MDQKIVTREDLKKAYQQGFDARFTYGRTYAANPYRKDHLWQHGQWANGWRAADRDLSIQAATA